MLFFNSIYAFSQKSKKEIANYYKELHKIDTNDIKNGKHLELAKHFTIETFVSYYLEHSKVIDTKKNSIQTITELFADAEFTYFGKTYAYGLIDFIKVPTPDLTKIDLRRLDGNEITDQFIKQVVPQADKENAERKMKGCISVFINPKFEYQYKKNYNYIMITYKWKITCDFFRIINKTYSAKLNLSDYTLTK